MIRTFRAPGRVNLIGEHTDYNQGLVLPMALDLATFVESAPNNTASVFVHSEHYKESREWPVDAIPQLEPVGDWGDYVAGVARELVRAGYRIEPRRLFIRSTVPEGAGLSSSAALEISCALALSFDQSVPPLELAKIGQRAEVEFVGLPCGIMDQYVSVFGREGTALMIDCLNLERQYVALPSGVSILAVNSMVKHSLARSAYRDRTEECAEAARCLGVRSLRDVSLTAFEVAAPAMPEAARNRARHVIEENERVRRFAVSNDPVELGRLLVESHRSLQHLYEVSCEELDFLVDAALEIDGVHGARVTGGGFGGCTINLVREGCEAGFTEAIQSAYRRRFGISPAVYRCVAAAGAGEIAPV
ncbi:MAG: galactokinase [Bryobacterales bacterium]|nr:galactokinase [Bryobacterales bacterium]